MTAFARAAGATALVSIGFLLGCVLEGPSDEQRPVAMSPVPDPAVNQPVTQRTVNERDLPGFKAGFEAGYNSEVGPQDGPQVTMPMLEGSVLGKSMEEVRNLLGPPSNVEDMSDDGYVAWYYWENRVAVYDVVSGTTSGFRIDFSTSDTRATRVKAS